MGFKLSALKRLVQVKQRRTELEEDLELLQPKVEEEALIVFLDDLHHDATQRQATITELASPSGRVYSTMESGAIETFLRMLPPFEGSSVSANRSETKHDAATGRLHGHAHVEIRADPLDIVAFVLSPDGRYSQSLNAADPRMVRYDTLEHVNAHHTIAFLRYQLPGTDRDRTFLFSTIAKQLADDPPTYAVVSIPIRSHDKIGPKDEAGAVRAENFRGFRLTAAAPGVSRLEYCWTLDLRGRVPHLVADNVASPAQMKVTAPLRGRCLPGRRHAVPRTACHAGRPPSRAMARTPLRDAGSAIGAAVLPAGPTAQRVRCRGRTRRWTHAGGLDRQETQTEGSGARHPDICK